MTTNKNTIPPPAPIKPHVRCWSYVSRGVEKKYWVCEEPRSVCNGMRYCTGATPREAYNNYVEEYLSEQQTTS